MLTIQQNLQFALKKTKNTFYAREIHSKLQTNAKNFYEHDMLLTNCGRKYGQF